MKTFKFRLIIVIILFFSKLLFSQTDNKLFWGETNLIHSEILGDDREYWIHLPMDYEKRGQYNYPVLYVTDGDEHFFLASGLTEFLSSQFIIPKFIVVAIFHKDRNHDLTPTHCSQDVFGNKGEAAKVSGGGEKLLQFIEKELIVQVEEKYRASSYRILAGHSLGGLLCTYAYLTRSNLFKGFISMDPALNWDNYVCEQTLKSLPGQAPNFKNKLYISSAHNAPEEKRDKGPLRKSQLSFTKELKNKGVNNTQFEIFEKETHLTVPYRSLYAGLTFIFPDYYIFKNPKFSADIPFIEAFYKKISDSYGMNIIPPEYLIEMLGKYFLFENTDYVKAIALFKLNTINYPDSYKAFDFLGKAYKASGDIDNATLSFKKSLKLNQNNSDTQKLLFELESK
jgi:predicted alpha/beta superfamily hydrolase